MNELTSIKTISEFHQINALEKPEHPLISLIDYSKMHQGKEKVYKWTQGFYSIGLKRDVQGKFRYGQLPYDFDEGLLSFFAPDQVINIDFTQPIKQHATGWILLIHPDFLWNTPLAEKIKQYPYFGYSLNEALFLSDKEEQIILQLFQYIKQEYAANIDDFSKTIIISQIELLLSYSERFYKRQFHTREQNNHEILVKFESLLDSYYSAKRAINGFPSVQSLAEKMNLTADYLSSTLKHLTGQNASQHIQNKVLYLAKTKLSTTSLSVSEIAYGLGFEYPQSFNKFFKTKTQQTPLEFRGSFN